MKSTAHIFDELADDTLMDVPVLTAGMENSARPLDIPESPTLRRRTTKRRKADLHKTATAASVIGTLPEPGETLHLRMDARYDGMHLIEAILEIAAVPCAELHVSTLSFNRHVAARLIELHDAGKVRHVTFVVSEMFSGKERAQVEWLRQALSDQGGTLRIARSHCKLLLFKLSDGRLITCEGSQNLRTCRCYEQVSITADPALYHWHRTFIEGL